MFIIFIYSILFLVSSIKNEVKDVMLKGWINENEIYH